MNITRDARAEHLRAAALRVAFMAETGAREIRWSGHNLSRLLRATGERPQRIHAMRKILGRLGMGDNPQWPSYSTGVFDHGEMWGRAGKPWSITGAPYHVGDDQAAMLAELASRFSTLRIALDERESIYGWGTRFVQIEVNNPLPPFDSIRSTDRTRQAARDARRAFRREGLPPIVESRPTRDAHPRGGWGACR